MNNFLSRGGIKLQAAIDNWKLSRRISFVRDPRRKLPSGKIENLVCLDVGSSTGGFVDCLLQNGAKKVYALDTCYGELAWKLRNDPKVVVMERTNILYLDHLPGVKAHLEGGETKDTSGVGFGSPEVDGVDKVDLITIDAGWTKLELILPVVKKFLKKGGIIIALLKPHYEAGKQFKGGVVPEELVENIKSQVLRNIKDLGFKIEFVIDSPILGQAGNKEFLLKIVL